ncbi:hypothetical protein [Paractinoplanes rishiriensis]|uniref:Uncharacterized protein n=1 Tax=Paractinoplanes rishiriensis TaxID=1050105 RepID=A0A919KBU6_9ACTN|nr:hypothetical protein [Actinoplanes rishiriensis]GIF02394.1 hypothetical protein Ari01nite_98580 [Actinoplanes rishiriensis]
MNVTPVGVKRSVRSRQVWLAAGAAFVLAIVGVAAEWYLEGYWSSQELLAAVEVVQWVCSVATVVLTFTAIILSTKAAVRRLLR